MRSAQRASIGRRGHRCRRERSETALSRLLTKVAKKAGSSASRGKIAPKPDKVTACLATRLHNFPDRESFLPGRHFSTVPPGEVASPSLSTAPAVPAPCVLASFGEGLELPVVVPVAPFFIAAPPVVVLLFIFYCRPRHCPARAQRCWRVPRLLRAKWISSSWSFPPLIN
jgi:hypothetical protein